MNFYKCTFGNHTADCTMCIKAESITEARNKINKMKDITNKRYCSFIDAADITEQDYNNFMSQFNN